MKIKIITIMITVLALVSCKKEKDTGMLTHEESKGIDGFIRKTLVALPDSPMYGTLSLGAYRNSGGASTVHYVLNGDFFSTTPPHLSSNRVDVGQIDFGNITLTPNTSNMSSYYIPYTQTYNTAYATNFGQVTTFSAAGNSGYGIGAFNDNIYVPKIVELTGPFTGATIGTHSSTSSMNVTWNSDVNNLNGMAVFLAYNGPMSHRADSTLPDSSFVIGYLVSDNGSYTIPASQFSGFSTGSFIEVGVGRLNEGVKETGGRRYRIIGYSYATALFELY